tara:strand:- start:1942 stop:3222 length:1281 start_codon:yes stop_codon:yes gene_type:complete
METYHIHRVIIEGFWSNQKIDTKFHRDVNIFIGKNGTGKTTFINLLQGILSVNFDYLRNIQFSNVEITLKKGRSHHKIRVYKEEEDLEYKAIVFKIDQVSFPVPFSALDSGLRTGRVHPKVLSMIEAIKTHLDSLYNISYLSVHRELQEIPENEYASRRRLISNVDQRLNKLMRELTSFQLRLETEANELSKAFESDVLQSMLYDETIDTVDFTKPIEINLKELKNGLNQAYQELGSFNQSVASRISQHIQRIDKAAKSINNWVKKKEGGIDANDIVPLALLRRTEKIINLSRDTESKRKEIFAPINNYIHQIQKYIEDKNFIIQQRGGLRVEKNGQSFHTGMLSSGEKQLLILLTEALLQEGKEFIYIADEPELSLHISWQRMILPSLVELNPNAQLIVATHSPEIAGKRAEKIITMESILSYYE